MCYANQNQVAIILDFSEPESINQRPTINRNMNNKLGPLINLSKSNNTSKQKRVFQKKNKAASNANVVASHPSMVYQIIPVRMSKDTNIFVLTRKVL